MDIPITTHCRRWLALVAGMALVGALGMPCLGQPAKLTIYVRSQTDDQVGKRVVFSLREAIRRSSSYELADEEQGVLQIEVISVDAEAGQSSAISVVGSVVTSPCGDKVLFHHKMWRVGSDRADDTGGQILADLDDAWTAAKQEMKRRRDKTKCDAPQ
jgi:hypothetical protein